MPRATRGSLRETDVLLEGGHQHPGPPQVSSVVVSGVGAPLPFGTGASPTSNDLFVCRLGTDQGVLSGTLEPTGWLTYI